MIRASLTGIEATKLWEERLYQSLKYPETGIVPIISLACYLAEHGLTVTAYHQNSDQFWKSVNDDIRAKLDQLQRYKKAYNAGVTLKTETKITKEVLCDLLQESQLVMCGVEYQPYRVKHAVLLYGYKESEFLYIDPLYGNMCIEMNQLIQEMQTEFGTWCIAVTSIAE